MKQTRPQHGFGLKTYNLDVMVKGTKTLQEFLDSRVHLVNSLGMDMAGMDPDIHVFPLPDGRGGQGLTILQPFVETLLHQPLTTSFMVFDIWPNWFTVTIKSCIKFSFNAVCQEIARIFGEILDFHSWVLGVGD
jgi:hypothetical protein